jgi:hypothetical protein
MTSHRDDSARRLSEHDPMICVIRTFGIVVLILVCLYDLYSVIDSFSGVFSGVVTFYDLIVFDVIFSVPTEVGLLLISLFSVRLDRGWQRWIAFGGVVLSAVVLLLNALEFVSSVFHYYS